MTNDSGFLTSHQDLSGYIPKSGGSVLGGTELRRTTNNEWISIHSASNGMGSYLNLESGSSDDAGTFNIHARTNLTDDKILRGSSSGSLTWGSLTGGGYKNVAMAEDVVPRSGGAVFSGTEYSRTVDNSTLNLYGGTSWTNGAQLQLFGKNWADPGAFVLYATSDANTRSMLYGKPNGTLTWNGKNLAMQEDTVPRSGGAVITGPIFSRTVNDSEFRLDGGTTWGQGASLSLSGKDRPGATGLATLHTSDGTDTSDLLLRPNGIFALVTNGTSKYVAMQEDTIPRSGGPVITGLQIGRTNNDSYLNFCGGTEWGDGATVSVRGANAAVDAGVIFINVAAKTQGAHQMNLNPNGTWAWTGQAVQLTSDQRLKQQIAEIDDKLLDAWEDVDLVQFKYNDAVDQKGDTARLHTGYVVQQIDEACKSHNLDISAYGLYCHEEYPERTEEVTTENEDGTTSKETKVIEPAREYYSLRYTETLVVECAYLRREVSKLKQQNEDLEQRLKMLEQSVK